MTIQLVLTDDWELRGNGSGNMRAIQFATLRRLRSTYETNGLHGSFNAEVMQQLAHLRFGQDHAELRVLASEWEELVRDTYSRGHDVQLHLHPQWSQSNYTDGSWALSGAWSLVDYTRESIGSMLAQCKEYLEGLLRPIDPSYRCVSFRAGSWCVAPSPDALDVLSELGFVFDMSVVDGIVSSTGRVRIDYRNVDEPFLPYYPFMHDARLVADSPQPIVCVPTHTFRPDVPLLSRPARRRDPRPPASLRFRLARGIAQRMSRRKSTSHAGIVDRYLLAPSDKAIPNAGYSTDYGQQVWGQEPAAGTSTTRVSDLAQLSLGQMREMLRDIRRRARASGWSLVPVVIENHTKDIGDFGPIDQFLSHVSRQKDIEVITASELATNLEAGLYPVRRAHG
jgi:hypothetical protein